MAMIEVRSVWLIGVGGAGVRITVPSETAFITADQADQLAGMLTIAAHASREKAAELSAQGEAAHLIGVPAAGCA